MADKQTKIQPADAADVAAGTTPDTGATDELPDYTVEQFAGLPDEQKLALMGNVKKFRAEATQKSQEAAEIRRQNEQLKAEREYFKSEATKREELLNKYYDSLTRSQQQPERSTPSQPPEYDPYNPDKSYAALQKYHDEKLNQHDSKYAELKKEFDSLKEETNVGLRTMKMERYLEKAIPQMGPDVSQEEVVLWFNMHPDVEPNTESINQALRERQSIYDAKVQAKYEEYLKEKEKAAENAQETPGAAFAGGAPDVKKWLEMSEAEREKEMTKFFSRGGGTR